MGKRELVLILAFALVGVATYQLSAPAAQPGERGFSLARIIEDLRSHLDLDVARVERRVQEDWLVPAEVTEIQVTEFNGSIRIVGEDREDIRGELRLEAFGPDESQARAAAERVDLDFEREGHTVRVLMRAPSGGRRPRGTLYLQVPRRLSGRFAASPGPLEARGLSVVVLTGRGEVMLSEVAGAVTGEHRAGDLRIEGAGRVELTTRQSDIRIADIRGDALVYPTGGNVSVRRIGGGLTVEGRRADIEADDVGGPIAIINAGGRIDLRGVRTPTTVEGRETEISIELAQAAPLKVIGNREDVAITVPADASVTIDARARQGTIRVDESLNVDVTGDADERRARGDVNRGGPEMSLEVNRGDIVIRRAPPAGATAP